MISRIVLILIILMALPEKATAFLVELVISGEVKNTNETIDGTVIISDEVMNSLKFLVRIGATSLCQGSIGTLADDTFMGSLTCSDGRLANFHASMKDQTVSGTGLIQG